MSSLKPVFQLIVNSAYSILTMARIPKLWPISIARSISLYMKFETENAGKDEDGRKPNGDNKYA